MNAVAARRSYATQMQDLFAYYLLGEKGYFLDFGCWMPTDCNNTKMLEDLGWDGLLFDSDPQAVATCNSVRKAPAFCTQILSPDFKSKFTSNLKQKNVDYISIDIDMDSLELLEYLIDTNVTFNALTFEHNLYSQGSKYKDPSMAILQKAGYYCLYENIITIPSHCADSMRRYPDGQQLEDWWINPAFFDDDLLTLYRKDIPFEKAIAQLKDHRELS